MGLVRELEKRVPVFLYLKIYPLAQIAQRHTMMQFIQLTILAIALVGG